MIACSDLPVYGIFSFRKLCYAFFGPPWWFLPLSIILIIIVMYISRNIEKRLWKKFSYDKLQKIYFIVILAAILITIIVLLNISIK